MGWEEQPRDDHGRFTSGGGGAHVTAGDLTKVFAQPKTTSLKEGAKQAVKGSLSKLVSKLTGKKSEKGEQKEGEKKEGSKLGELLDKAKEVLKEKSEGAIALEKTALSEGGLAQAAGDVAGSVGEGLALHGTGLGAVRMAAKVGSHLPGEHDAHGGRNPHANLPGKSHEGNPQHKSGGEGLYKFSQKYSTKGGYG